MAARTALPLLKAQGRIVEEHLAFSGNAERFLGSECDRFCPGSDVRVDIDNAERVREVLGGVGFRSDFRPD